MELPHKKDRLVPDPMQDPIQGLPSHIAEQLGAMPGIAGRDAAVQPYISPDEASNEISAEDTAPTRAQLVTLFERTIAELNTRGTDRPWPVVEHDNRRYVLHEKITPDDAAATTWTLMVDEEHAVTLYVPNDDPTIILQADLMEDTTPEQETEAAQLAADSLGVYHEGIMQTQPLEQDQALAAEPSPQNSIYVALTHRLPTIVRRGAGILAVGFICGLSLPPLLTNDSERAARLLTERRAAAEAAQYNLTTTEQTLGGTCIAALQAYRNDALTGLLPAIETISECGSSSPQRRAAYIEYTDTMNAAEKATSDLEKAAANAKPIGPLNKGIMTGSSALLGASFFVILDISQYPRRRK